MEKILNDDQLIRLRDYADHYGKNWRDHLRDAWRTGADVNEYDGHLLRQIRNTVGPSGLEDIDFPVLVTSC